MRVVADTNTVVSGLLWRGSPWQVLETARQQKVKLFTSPVLLAELQDVLARAKFATRLKAAGVTADELVVGYAALATLVHPDKVQPVISADPDDDQVLACAATARAEAIVSGDQHLIALGEYGGIPILTAAVLLQRVGAGSS